MIDICSETTEFFLATYYQIIKSGHDMKNEKRGEKSQTGIADAIKKPLLWKNKPLKFLIGIHQQSKTQRSALSFCTLKKFNEWMKTTGPSQPCPLYAKMGLTAWCWY